MTSYKYNQNNSNFINYNISNIEPSIKLNSLLNSNTQDYFNSTQDYFNNAFEIINLTDRKITTKSKSLDLKFEENIFRNKILNMLEYIELSYGIISPVEEYIIEYLKKDKDKYQNYINNLFLDNFKDTGIIIKLIHIISHIDFNLIAPAGPTMLLGVFSHENNEVVDNAIRAFENWFNKDTLSYLESIKLREIWLQDDLNILINELKELK